MTEKGQIWALCRRSSHDRFLPSVIVGVLLPPGVDVTFCVSESGCKLSSTGSRVAILTVWCNVPHKIVVIKLVLQTTFAHWSRRVPQLDFFFAIYMGGQTSKKWHLECQPNMRSFVSPLLISHAKPHSYTMLHMQQLRAIFHLTTWPTKAARPFSTWKTNDDGLMLSSWGRLSHYIHTHHKWLVGISLESSSRHSKLL